MMKVMHIGIFGAQGGLGENLYKRLQSIMPVSTELLPTVDRKHNKEIAQVCDLAVIVVRPNQVEDLLREIAPHLKPAAQVLSFAAYYPLNNLHRHSGRACARGMADPWWSVSAFFREVDFDIRGIEFILSGLTKMTPLSLHSDSEINAFTIHMCQLFVTLFLEQKGEVVAKPHLNYLAERMQNKAEELKALVPSGNPDELLATISTKGGISEMIAALIHAKPEMKPEDIFAEVAKSFSDRF